MKDKIKEKFFGIKHKWIYFNIDSKEFQDILNVITESIRSKKITSKNAISLTKCFKFHEKAFVKFIKTAGRKNFTCLCQIIDKENNKLEIKFKPEEILESALLSDTPKSLKLYKTKESNKGAWKKPDDGFLDDIQYPPIEEELTELGYRMYKDWTEEVRASGMSSIDYYRKILGIDKYYKRG
tara:strand:- start:32 stop:577 length:546 start_codon:yes stop_codon:yes gene_type:complete